MREHRVSFRYAKALLDSAQKEGVADTIFEDFQKVKMTFEMSDELQSLAASPVFQLWRKKKIFEEIFKEESISKMTMDFLLLLVDKRRGSLILSIISEYETQYNIANKRLPISVYSAIDLDDNSKDSIIKKVSENTQMTILPEYFVDEKLKGGIVIRIRDWVYDASIKNQLKLLHKKLAEG